MPAHKKPTALKKMQGTYREDRETGEEIEPVVEIPKCPTHLKKEARREWDRITAELAELGLIAQVDRAALAAYCSCWMIFVECDKVLMKDGLLFKTPKGHEQPRAEISIRRGALDQMKAFLIEFGMTPAARSRIRLPGKKTDAANPFKKLGLLN